MGCRIQQHTNDKQNLLAKSAENMLLAINKQIQIYHVMTYIYIRRKKRNNTKKFKKNDINIDKDIQPQNKVKTVIFEGYVYA